MLKKIKKVIAFALALTMLNGYGNNGVSSRKRRVVFLNILKPMMVE
mgnify:CR=1 FL=1